VVGPLGCQGPAPRLQRPSRPLWSTVARDRQRNGGSSAKYSGACRTLARARRP